MTWSSQSFQSWIFLPITVNFASLVPKLVSLVLGSWSEQVMVFARTMPSLRVKLIDLLLGKLFKCWGCSSSLGRIFLANLHTLLFALRLLLHQHLLSIKAHVVLVAVILFGDVLNLRCNIQWKGVIWLMTCVVLLSKVVYGVLFASAATWVGVADWKQVNIVCFVLAPFVRA